MPTLEELNRAGNHFALFSLPRSFDIDPALLQRRYLELTRLTHPDFAGADPEAQTAAMDLSARVNDAHKVLADPEERANYLLELLGGAAKEQDKSLPKGFLERMLFVREEMEEAQESKDEAALAAIENQAKGKRQEHIANLSKLFSQVDSNPEALRLIRLELNALRYIERMLEQTRPDVGII